MKKLTNSEMMKKLFWIDFINDEEELISTQRDLKKESNVLVYQQFYAWKLNQ